MCASMMPGWLSQMLAPALAAVQACADASAEDTCDMMLLMPTCQAEPPGDTLDCQNPCLLQLFACQGNPMLPMIFGEDVAGRVPGIQAMCVAPEGATGAGDGICDVQKLMACSHGPGGAWSELEAECGPEDNAEQFWRAVARKMRTTKPWRRVMSRGRRDKLRSKVRAGSRSASRWAATPGEVSDV